METITTDTNVTVELQANIALTDEEKNVIRNTLSRASCFTIFLLIFVLPISILKIYLGCYYKNECPVQPKIPYFLYISGIIGSIIVFCLLGTILFGLIAGSKIIRENKGKNGVGKSFVVALVLGIISILLNVFSFIWLICGIVWIFSVINQLSYDPEDGLNYCHRQLYLMTIILLVIGLAQSFGQLSFTGPQMKR